MWKKERVLDFLQKKVGGERIEPWTGTACVKFWHRKSLPRNRKLLSCPTQLHFWFLWQTQDALIRSWTQPKVSEKKKLLPICRSRSRQWFACWHLGSLYFPSELCSWWLSRKFLLGPWKFSEHIFLLNTKNSCLIQKHRRLPARKGKEESTAIARDIIRTMRGEIPTWAFCL